jgi:hypothetical protein
MVNRRGKPGVPMIRPAQKVHLHDVPETKPDIIGPRRDGNMATKMKHDIAIPRW